MKKMMMTLTAVFCCAMVMSSCSKDDKGNNDVPDTTPASANVDFIIRIDPDMLQCMDLTAEYMDANGNVQSEKVTSITWMKSLSFTKFPAKLAARLHLAKKSGVNYAEVSNVTVGAVITRRFSIFNKAGSLLNNATGEEYSFTEAWLSGDDLVKFIEDEGENFKSLLLEYDAKGKETQGTWND